jgi:hypothetical protein
VDAPGTDWVAIPNGLQGHLHYGPLDAKTLAAESANASAVSNELSSEQFTRSYRKGWGQRGTDVVLVQKVEEFAHPSGAADHLSRSKFADQADAAFKGLFATPGLDQGYGASFVQKDGWRSAGVVFTKGNLLFSVIGGSSRPVNTNLLLRQAIQQYIAAPDQTVIPATPPGAPAAPSVQLITLIAGGGALFLLVVSVGVGLAIWLPNRREEREKTLIGSLPTFSPDRRYWWDGGQWVDGTVVAPPMAPRSPDGAHWFDGATWRPVPAVSRALSWPPQMPGK